MPGLEGRKLGDFWSWAYLQLEANTVRPLFAEWLVGTLLGVESDGRTEWDAVDLVWRGHGIEVKSSAYVQAWHRPGSTPSKIVFDIAPKRSWDPVANKNASVPGRPADLYVFCVYPERDLAQADPIDVPAWRFWVISTTALEVVFGQQKSASLKRIEGLARPVDYLGLENAVVRSLGPDG